MKTVCMWVRRGIRSPSSVSSVEKGTQFLASWLKVRPSSAGAAARAQEHTAFHFVGLTSRILHLLPPGSKQEQPEKVVRFDFTTLLLLNVPRTCAPAPRARAVGWACCAPRLPVRGTAAAVRPDTLRPRRPRSVVWGRAGASPCFADHSEPCWSP